MTTQIVNKWQAELSRTLATSRNVQPLGDGLAVDVIRRAEQRIGLPFPESFKAFLRAYGGALVRGHELNGVIREAHGDAPPLPLDAFYGDIVAEHQRNLRDPSWPRNLVELLTFDGDETVCFDVSTFDDGECDVVVVDHRRFHEARRVAANLVQLIDYLG